MRSNPGGRWPRAQYTIKAAAAVHVLIDVYLRMQSSTPAHMYMIHTS